MYVKLDRKQNSKHKMCFFLYFYAKRMNIHRFLDFNTTFWLYYFMAWIWNKKKINKNLKLL